jgi:hypothetical protein
MKNNTITISNYLLELVKLHKHGFLPMQLTSNFPSRISNSQNMNNVYNCIDVFLQNVLPFLCTNYLFIARKRVDRETKKTENQDRREMKFRGK